LTTLVELLKMEEHQIPLKMQKDLLYPHFEPLHCQINPFWGFLNVSPPHKDLHTVHTHRFLKTIQQKRSKSGCLF